MVQGTSLQSGTRTATGVGIPFPQLSKAKLSVDFPLGKTAPDTKNGRKKRTAKFFMIDLI
jgi:hypothetical protein